MRTIRLVVRCRGAVPSRMARWKSGARNAKATRDRARLSEQFSACAIWLRLSPLRKRLSQRWACARFCCRTGSGWGGDGAGDQSGFGTATSVLKGLLNAHYVGVQDIGLQAETLGQSLPTDVQFHAAGCDMHLSDERPEIFGCRLARQPVQTLGQDTRRAGLGVQEQVVLSCPNAQIASQRLKHHSLQMRG